ncbi:hypothetical protein JHK82_020480 [Glycine max]|nr:hypothetical protein JHK87_020376 [Glycine soja]KAG5014797.1 hypothetical protein JHK85_020933 [Glycine max]KAG5024580.1 hypothetical protein JHK86_020494 [Glycine max]KAG5135749.1 hypothetical protein JHK82_020480 [Glycine max]
MYMSYAKIASASGFSDMNLIILKATAPDDLPLHEKYIQHLFKLLSISPSASLFDLGPRVAGVLHSSVSFFFTVCFALSPETAPSGLRSYGHSLIDRVMECYPVGVAAPSFIVQGAMKLIIRDSFVCYTKFRREIVAVLDNLLEMPYRNCIAAFNIYKKAAAQTNELYEWCKAKGLCEGQVELRRDVVHIKGEEEKPLIELEFLFYHREFDMEQHSFDANEGHYHENANDTWRMAVYNPFSEPY